MDKKIKFQMNAGDAISFGEKQLALRYIVGLTISLILVGLWSYWDMLYPLFKELSRDDDYSVGQLVPLAAIFAIWHDRKSIRALPLKPCWWGLVLILIGQAIRFFGLLFMYESVERYSFVYVVAGLVLLVGGWRRFLRVFWVIMFLFLMFPLPTPVHNMISGPLQTFASNGSVFMLEVIGVRVSQQGNTMMLNDKIQMTVVEACSGLRMLTAFVVVSAMMAFMVNRSRKRKAVLFLSSIPIAIICNVIRLCATAILYIWASSEAAEKFFHDFAGLVMMPIAVFIIFGEIWLMDKLIIQDESDPVALKN